MMMQTIREKTRWAIVFLAVAFAAWLAFEGIQSRETAATSGTDPVIGIVNGQDIRFNRWREASAAQLDRARQARGRALTDEEIRQSETEAWENLVRDVLIEQEIRRIGIKVTDAEVSQAFRTSPPPFVIRSPAFQTDGQFDYAKYQAYFSDPSVDEQLLLSIEQYYRDQIPRIRLQEQLSAGVAVSDLQAWEEFKARNETAVVTHVTVDPAQFVEDSEISVSEDEARRYYREHAEDFERPATATVRMVSFSTLPTPGDTARVVAFADSLRAAILADESTFAEAAEEHSADSTSAPDGGEIGAYTPEDLREPISSTVAGLDTGGVSEPVTMPDGIHLFHVAERTGDTASIAHILLPIRLSEQTEDELFGRMDRVEGIALDDGLLAARDSLDLDVREGVVLTEGFDFVPGAGSLGVGVDWALDGYTEIGELSEFYENSSGYHLLELVDRTEAGRFAFEDVREQIEATLRFERRLETARQKAEQIVAGLPERTIEALAAATDWPMATTEPFNRLEFVPGLGRATEAVGAAFTAPTGVMVGPYEGADRLAFLRVDERTEADADVFSLTKDELKAEIAFRMAEQRTAQWLEALRDEAVVVDHRDRLNRPVEDQPVVPPMI
ncbi:MAG TPA: SurA N-terminal domain-containing protein [Gemmatimonadota bacterium]|nr:SurA N-terminal domain-containing protein [Gemmatimonadota bacterium]